MLLNIVSHSLCPCYYLLDIVLYAHKTATILHWSVEDKDGQNQFESVPLNLKVKWNVWSLEHTRWPWFKLTAVYDHKTIWETVSESIHLKCGNKPCLLFCAAPLTVEIHLINANLPFTLSLRVKGIKISMEMQSMNNGNLRKEIQRGAIWSSACQGNCILFPYLFLSP